MRTLTVVSVLALTALAGVGQAEAKGCLKGAVVGGSRRPHGRPWCCRCSCWLRHRSPPREPRHDHQHDADLDGFGEHDHDKLAFVLIAA